MARILYIAMSCGPNRGSEDAIGWNLPLAMSRRGNDVFVLTRADKREEIETYLAAHPDERGPEYLYEAQTPLELKMNGPLVSAKVASWCRRVSKKLPGIVEAHRIEVVHQITPIEFRAVIDADLDNVAMFLGPIGGAEKALPALASYLKTGSFVESLRLRENSAAARRLKHLGVLRRFKGVWCANRETREYLKQNGVDSSDFEIMTEIGVSDKLLARAAGSVGEKGHSSCGHESNKKLRLAYIGRLVPRKGVAALLDACSILRAKKIPFELEVYGDGPQRAKLENRASALSLNEITFHGAVPHSQIEEAFRNADALVMPSIRETGGAVLAEAATFNLPVIAFDAFGAHVVLQGSTSILVDPNKGVEGLAEAIERVANAGLPSGRTMNGVAHELLWSKKASYLQRCYQAGRCIPLAEEVQNT